MQFLEDAETIWEVTHRIYGEGRVEARVLERKLPARIYLQETGATVETSLSRELPGGGDAFGEDVDADYGQADRFSEAKCRAARSAADVEEARFDTEVEPFREALELVDRQPARLAEVVAVRLPADLLSGSEAGIGGNVEGHVFPHVPSVVPPALDGQWRRVLVARGANVEPSPAALGADARLPSAQRARLRQVARRRRVPSRRASMSSGQTPR